MKAPALVVAGEKSAADPYTRSAVSLSYSRTLDLLKKLLGPHYDLEKLWEKHTYYVRSVTGPLPYALITFIITGIRRKGFSK